jgi:hypothetical protein
MRYICACLALLTLLTEAGCGRRLASPPTQEAINGYFAVTADRSAERPSQELDVYIDGSASMKGFVHTPGSHYVSVVSNILERGSSAAQYPAVARFRFPGSQRQDVERVDVHVGDILSESFYSGTDTPLSRVLDHIAANNGNIAIVISDFVESDKLADENALQDSFRRLAAKHREMRLLGYRSNFDGYYYPENRRNGGAPFQIAAREELPNTGRPFYVLVVAPDRASLDSAQGYVLDGTGPAYSFTPTESAVAAAKASLAKEQVAWNDFADADSKTLRSGATRTYGSFREGRASGNDSSLRLDVSGDVRAPLRRVERIRAVIRHGVYQKGRLQERPADVELAVKVSGKSDGDSAQLNVTFPFPRPSAGNWDVYEAKFYPGDANLSPPVWVRNWSTDSDELERNKNRTFRLASLVETMIHAITEKTAIFEEYISVGRN